MLLLNPANKILADTVGNRIRGDDADEADAKGGEMDVRLCDFDDVTYHVRVASKEADSVQLSMSVPFYDAIKEHGAADELKAAFGDTVADEPADGQSLTLDVKLDGSNLPCDRAEFVDRVGMLRATVVGGVFKKYLGAVAEGTKPEPFRFEMRHDTTVYFAPGDDRVVVIYEFSFTERVDQVVASVFMKEFAESRRRLGEAPPCSFSHNPPAELAQFGVTEPTGSLGFISFAMLKTHVNSPEKVSKAAGSLQMFRNYLQYHIKCSKSYFHARMRARVRVLLKVLNRAKQEQDEGKEKKTISGKTFTRK